jgi:Flp pilus assembly protein TadG
MSLRPIRDLWGDRGGATLVEAAIVFPMLLVLTFGLVEFGNLLWEYNTAEKATAAGARYLATRGPLAPQLTDGSHDCFGATPSTATAGTSCADPSLASGATITCLGAGSSGCTQSVMDGMIASMQQIAPFVATANVQVVLRPSKEGFVGRGAAVPLITVRLTGLTYAFVTLGSLLGLDPITLPGFDATITGEDQQEGSPT